MSRGLAPPMGGAWNRRELIGATAAALLGGLSPSVAQAGPAALGEVVRWPRVTLLDGRPLDAAQLAGVATVVVFFSTQCPYCQRHNRHVDKLQRTTLGQPLQILAAAQDRNAQAVQDYLRRHDYRFAATLDERALHDALTPRRVIPLTCVIDRAGRLRGHPADLRDRPCRPAARGHSRRDVRGGRARSGQVGARRLIPAPARAAPRTRRVAAAPRSGVTSRTRPQGRV